MRKKACKAIYAFLCRKLTHQARIIQQTKATANKNITVVPLTPHKRQSTESSAEIIIPPKVARIAEPAEVEVKYVLTFNVCSP